METFREWLDGARASGSLKDIKGADWHLEIGALSALNVKRRDCPALLFDDIKDYPTGHRVLTCSTSSRELLARTFNVPSCASDLDLIRLFRERLPQWEAAMKDMNPKIVTSGPVMENVHDGEAVDLLKFPVPKWHEMDAGRYIGTGDAVITRDPESGDVNLGTYRIVVHDRKTLGLFITPGKHGRLHVEKYHSRNESCPVAVSVGHHPLFFRTAGSKISAGGEYNFIGAVSGKPVKVINDPITGLPIPADSEIVLVGWCPPDRKKVEGPFGEWTGYYASRPEDAPVIEVERIYHRNNPVILGSPPSRPPHDSAYFRTIVGSAFLHDELTKNGIPDVRGVWLTEAGLELMIVISLKQRYPGHVKQAGLFATQNRLSASLGRHVIIVDEDIDPSNTNDVLWALCTRCDPQRDIQVVDRMWASSLETLSPPSTKVHFSSRAIFDACKPYEWLDEFPQEVKIGDAVARQVTEKWGKELGL